MLIYMTQVLLTSHHGRQIFELSNHDDPLLITDAVSKEQYNQQLIEEKEKEMKEVLAEKEDLLSERLQTRDSHQKEVWY
jgi:hypothetical protein